MKNKLINDIYKTISYSENIFLSNVIIEEQLYYLTAKHLELNAKYMLNEEIYEWCELLEKINELRIKYYKPLTNISYFRKYDCLTFLNKKTINQLKNNIYNADIEEDTTFFDEFINTKIGNK